MKNIILITIDSMRADDIGYSKEESLTPNLDALASEGVVFNNAFSQAPTTKSSFPCIMSSTYPIMLTEFKKGLGMRLSIARVMRKHGYLTAAFNSNPYLSRYYGYDDGFDYFYDSFEFGGKTNNNPLIGKIKIIIKICKSKIPTKIKNLVMPFTYNTPYEDGIELNKKIKNWVSENKDKQFFLWIHYMDVHEPFIPDEKKAGISKKDMIKLNLKLRAAKEDETNLTENELKKIINIRKYDVSHMDEVVGDLIDRLKKMDVFRKSVLIITADHGDEFKEHGGILHTSKLYDELIHIPLIINGLDSLPKKINEVVGSIDIGPTIVDLNNTDKPDEWMGNSLLPLLDGRSTRNFVISEMLLRNKNSVINSIRTKKWKFIYDIAENKYELYDLHKDPKELNNISAEYSRKVEEFKGLIKEHYKNKEEKEKMIRRKKLKQRIKILRKKDD